MTPSSKTSHRWDLHALQALSKRDPIELTRVFTEIKDLPATAMDTQVQHFGCGAPMQFYNFGFFDKTGATFSSAALFDRVVDGDTMLLISLRNYDPKSSIHILKLGASLHVANAAGDSPLQLVFDAMAFFHLHPDANSEPNNDEEKRLLKLRPEYEELFAVLEDELVVFYNKKKGKIERELTELYQQFAPDRVAKIPAQLEAFEYREHLLLESVKKKYLG